jgi:hypothetical protein
MECIYDNVTDAAERVSIAENNVDKAELRLSKSREALTKLQQSGTASAIDLQQAQEQVKIAQENVNKATFMLSNTQEAYNETLVDSATNIIPGVFTSIAGLQAGFQGLGAIKKEVGKEGTKLNKIWGGMKGGGSRLANTLKAGLIPALTLGVEVAGAAIATWFAFGGALEALGHNVGGFRDAVRDTISWITEMSGSLAEHIGIFPEMNAAYQELGTRAFLYIDQMRAGWETMTNQMADFLGIQTPFAAGQEEIANKKREKTMSSSSRSTTLEEKG